jgi:hypothetical protein
MTRQVRGETQKVRDRVWEPLGEHGVRSPSTGSAGAERAAMRPVRAEFSAQ